ncbi:hypothetical protein NJL88_01975 [Streptomyces sp. DK15]|uniref:hypothetical protein n=1 Tax=Streptomyces sp. DK15 TaxID=2957499 RepID=UPI0029B7454E|nr:hypothetical protein [Streptomyces sp. DK15]MDX2388872.1 hypothetical protein [Streptomyces sp. DK15]
MDVGPRLLATATVLLAVLLAGCTERATPPSTAAPVPSAGTTGPASTAPQSPSADASASASASTSASASVPVAASPSPRPVAGGAVTTGPAAAPSAVPATRLTMSVDTRGGRILLVRGGPAQEFTLTLRNGNTRAYGHLLLTFQMEAFGPSPGDRPGPDPSVLLEHRDPATGRWSPAELRIANDFRPYHLHEGGSPLDRDAVRTERYRLRATATGPTGSSPLEVRLLDTDAPEGAGEARERPARLALPHTTRRAS